MSGEIVESFTLDHRKVKAPFVRKCSVETGKNGDKVSKFDLRFAQPNKEEVESPALHTLEHIMAGTMRKKIPEIIDVSPMGCRTGFYLTVWGEPSPKEIGEALVYALREVLDAEEIPAQNEIQCGNYRLHSLEGAKKWAEKILASNKDLTEIF